MHDHLLKLLSENIFSKAKIDESKGLGFIVLEADKEKCEQLYVQKW